MRVPVSCCFWACMYMYNFAFWLASVRASSNWVLRSSDVGVKECTFHGTYLQYEVVLHVFITACSSPVRADELYVSANYFMYAPRVLRIDPQVMQVPEAQRWVNETNPLEIRSPHSGRRWPFKLIYPTGLRWPGRAYANMTLDPIDQQYLEFNIHAYPKFRTYCSFMAGSTVSSPWPHIPAGSPSWGSQKCGWLGSGSGVPTQRHTYMIVSPFFGLNSSQYMSLLEHHMRYHERFGVDRYLVYIEDNVGMLELNPRVQALTQAGKLRVVFFNDVPHFYNTTLDPPVRHPYAFQAAVYNHALLALWHEDAIALVADLDEYLMTPKKTTVEKIFWEDPGLAKRTISTIRILRREAHFTGCCSVQFNGSLGPPASTQLSREALVEAHSRELAIWFQNSDDTKTLLHPLAAYGVSSTDLQQHCIKSAFIPHLVTITDPHRAWPTPGRRFLHVPINTIYWLHLRTQVEMRLPAFGNFTDPRVIGNDSLWALQELANKR